LRARHRPLDPVAQELSTHFKAIGLEEEIGQLKIKISGCINACGHHHVGHIGILGLDRAGVENYQITLGGDHTEHAAIGDKVGPGFAYDQVVPAIERLLRAYLDLRAQASPKLSSTPSAASARTLQGSALPRRGGA
jgi:sulfite reductase (NADPH) hemoprotein beta-component